jgi:glycosyltransferase involved in cell wall biosynthesis
MVATDVPGCREVVIHDHTGLLVPPEDVTGLAAAIEMLASSKDLRMRLGATARALAVDRFSADAIGEAVAKLYLRLAPANTGTIER